MGSANSRRSCQISARFTDEVGPEKRASTGRYTASFDKLNRELVLVNPAGKTITVGLDSGGGRRVLVNPDGGRLSYSFSKRDESVAIQNPEGDGTSWTFDAAGRQTVQLLPGKNKTGKNKTPTNFHGGLGSLATRKVHLKDADPCRINHDGRHAVAHRHRRHVLLPHLQPGSPPGATSPAGCRRFWAV